MPKLKKLKCRENMNYSCSEVKLITTNNEEQCKQKLPLQEQKRKKYTETQ